jgi:uncharacterized protein (DUF305 family)
MNKLQQAAFVALGALMACATPPAPQPAAQRPVAAELEALYRARADSARLRFTEADVRFMTDMIHHHAQAVMMAELAPSRTATPSIRTLAARILSSQQDEIALMLQWLSERGQTVPDLPPDHGHGAHHARTDMPGMLSPEQLRQLERARAADFDRLFLELMIQHHRGAVIMVHQLFATGGAGQNDVVFRFASDVQVDQRTEIARMERMLASLRGS